MNLEITVYILLATNIITYILLLKRHCELQKSEKRNKALRKANSILLKERVDII